MARPTKLTQAVRERIIEAIRMGSTMGMAAAHAGIGESTLLEWVRRGQGRQDGRPALPVFASFAEELARARDQGDLTLLVAWRKAATAAGKEGDWRAAQALLARRHPEFSQQHMMRMGGLDGGAIKVQSVPGDETPAREVVSGKVIEAAERFRDVG